MFGSNAPARTCCAMLSGNNTERSTKMEWRLPPVFSLLASAFFCRSVSREMPFDLSKHRLSGHRVAKSMFERLKGEMERYADMRSFAQTCKARGASQEQLDTASAASTPRAQHRCHCQWRPGSPGSRTRTGAAALEGSARPAGGGRPKCMIS